MLFEFYLLIYLRGAVCSAHLYLCLHVRPSVCAVCVGQRPRPGVFLCRSPPQFLKQNLSVTPGLTGPSLSFTSHPVFYMGVGDPTSGPYLYSSEPFPYWAISTAPRRTSRRLQERKGMAAWLTVLSFMPMSVCASNHPHSLKGSCWSLICLHSPK